MRTLRKLLVPALVAALPLVAFAAGGGPEKPSTRVTVGDFAVMLAGAGATGAAVDAQAATKALARTGVPLGDPAATLDERKLVEILDYYGLRATTRMPDAAVGAGKAAAAATLIAGTTGFIGTEMASEPGLDNAGDIDVCLEEKNHGQCVNCCKDLGVRARACSRFCQQINQGSPSEPLP